tara:strand:- start:264 stop:452 length:189 start_codon:yes stop_codon:yes gene_type:complete
MNKIQESRAYRNYASLHSETNNSVLFIAVFLFILVAGFTCFFYTSHLTINKAVDQKSLTGEH